MSGIDTILAGGKRRLCIIIPVHNEAENLSALVEELRTAASQLKHWDTEILFVDDGSSDASVQRMKEIRANGTPVGYLRLSKNFGHQAALCAGLAYASGDAVVMMDSDLQHPPAEIPRMVEAHERGADVVQMVRSDPSAVARGLFSTWAYRIFNKLSDTRIVPNAADFRLLSRRVVSVLVNIPEREKFLRGLIPSLGFNQTTLKFDQAERLYGTASYSYRMLLRMARKALFDYSTVPLKLVFWLGTAISLVSFTFGIGHIIWKLLHWDLVVPGFTDLITAIFFLSGCVLASLGILGRYTMMILDQVRARPAFVVMESIPGNTIPSSSPESFSVKQAAIESDERAALRKD
jgi:glycosyltransferase involved in cell wall biosynthesis